MKNNSEIDVEKNASETPLQKLNGVRAEWLLLLRDQEKIEARYNASIEAINKQTQALLLPIQTRIGELKAAEEQLLFEGKGEIYAHTQIDGTPLSNQGAESP